MPNFMIDTDSLCACLEKSTYVYNMTVSLVGVCWVILIDEEVRLMKREEWLGRMGEGGC